MLVSMYSWSLGVIWRAVLTRYTATRWTTNTRTLCWLLCNCCNNRLKMMKGKSSDAACMATCYNYGIERGWFRIPFGRVQTVTSRWRRYCKVKEVLVRKKTNFRWHDISPIILLNFVKTYSVYWILSYCIRLTPCRWKRWQYRLYTVFQKKWRQNWNHYNYGTPYQN